MRELVLVGALAVAASGAVAEEKVFDHNDFDQVSAARGVSVTIVKGDDFSVIGEAKSGVLRRLKIDQRGDELRISRKSAWGLWDATRNESFHVTVSMPELVELDVSSGASVTAAAFGAEGLEIKASSGSSVAFSQIAGGDVTLKASSGSTVKVTGSCAALGAEASSGSTIRADGLECATADMDGSSGAIIRAFARDAATAEGSSGAALYLAGGGTVTVQELSSGASLRN